MKIINHLDKILDVEINFRRKTSNQNLSNFGDSATTKPC